MRPVLQKDESIIKFLNACFQIDCIYTKNLICINFTSLVWTVLSTTSI